MASESRPAVSPESVTREPLSVLLVEDNAAERLLFTQILRKRGHDVTACPDGETGWEAFVAGDFALVLLDLGLPGGMDGLDVCRRIRTEALAVSPIVLVITGDTDPDALERVLDEGADDYVAKPIDPRLLNVRLAVAEREYAHRRERARVEMELASATEEMRTLFENLDDVFFSADLVADELLQVSPSVGRMLGVSTSDLESGRVDWRRLLMPPEARERLATEAAKGREDTVVVDLDPTKFEAAPRFVEGRFKPRLQGTKVTRVDAVLVDVTERRMAELALAARNRDNEFLARIGDLALTVRGYAEIVRATLQEVAAATGWPLVALARWQPEIEGFRIEHAEGLGPLEGADPPRLPGRASAYRRALDRGEACVVGAADLARQGDADPLAEAGFRTIVALPLRARIHSHGVLIVGSPSETGPPPRMLELLRSVTRLLALHLERARAEEDLRSRERSALELARDLGHANDELESFAYSVAHDLRAPLRTMQGFAHALMQRYQADLAEEALDFVRRIVRSGESAEGLISDLLSYSQLSVMTLEHRTVSLDEVVDHALERLNADIRETGADIRVERPLPEVESNHSVLVQAVLNLVSNGIKFSREGEAPSISIRAEPGADVCRLHVQDRGVGIDPGKVDRIFRVFERLSGDVHREGTGIGLAIVRRAMERLGGGVTVHSEPGVGSDFVLEIPTSRDGGA